MVSAEVMEPSQSVGHVPFHWYILATDIPSISCFYLGLQLLICFNPIQASIILSKLIIEQSQDLFADAFQLMRLGFHLPLSLHHFFELLVHLFHILDELQLIRLGRLLLKLFPLLGLPPPIHSLLLTLLLLFLNGLLICTLSLLQPYFFVILFGLNFKYLLRRCFLVLRLNIHPILHLIPHLVFFTSLLFHLNNLPRTIPKLILPTPIQPLRPTITILHLLPLHKRLRIHMTHPLVHLRILIVIHHIRVIDIRVHILILRVLRSPIIGRHLVIVQTRVHLGYDNGRRDIVLPVFMRGLRHDIKLVVQIHHAVSLPIVLVFIGRPRKWRHAVVGTVVILVDNSIP